MPRGEGSLGVPIGARIGVDARALAPPITGTGVYLRELLAELARQRPDLELFLYTTKAPVAGSAPARAELRLGSGWSSRWGTLWLQRAVPALARADGLDLFWGPLQVLPQGLLGRLPTVVTVHDLVFRRFPETMSWRNRIALAPVAARSIRGADRVIAVSATTARDAARELEIDPAHISVVRNAVGADFVPIERELAKKKALELLGASESHDDGHDHGRDYLLFVGTLEPRKNLHGLLEALSTVGAPDRFDGDVVIVGGAGWRNSSLSRVIAAHDLGPRLRLTGYVEPKALPSLYSGARLFVMPSFYEGFGLPIIEAMSCGTPVVCSSCDPFPEVAGGAAETFSPDDANEMAETISRVWNNEALRASLRERGLAHASQFRWADSARDLLEVFGQALAPRPGS